MHELVDVIMLAQVDSESCTPISSNQLPDGWYINPMVVPSGLPEFFTGVLSDSLGSSPKHSPGRRPTLFRCDN
jgi:hypothetical protein